jgi:hypothetical protein
MEHQFSLKPKIAGSTVKLTPHLHVPVRRPLSSRRGEALWERVEAGSGLLGVARLLSRPRGAVGSGPAAVESAAASVVALTCGVCVVGGFGWL